MRITHRTDFAIHLIADLAGKPRQSVGLRSLAEEHDVTYAYARTVQQKLLKAGIIGSTRGVNGGMRLLRTLESITLLEVFEAAQDPLDEAFGNDDTPWCQCKGKCMCDGVWKTTRKLLKEYYSKITLKQLIG